MNCFKVEESTLQNLLLKIENLLNGINKEKRYKAMLVCDEIFTNQLKHGNFEDKIADIEFCLNFKDDDIIMTFRDNAKPFNPLKNTQPNLETDLDETQLGGLGVFLVQQYTKTMEYTYKEKYNILKVWV